MKNEYLRHTLSTIAYRFQKSVRNSEIEFGNFGASKGSRTPNEIINHMFNVLRATRFYIQGESFDKEVLEKLNLKSETERFSLELKNIDTVLLEKELDINYTKKFL